MAVERGKVSRRILLVVALALALALTAAPASAEPPKYVVSCCPALGYNTPRGYLQANGDFEYARNSSGAYAITGDYWICDTNGDDAVVRAQVMTAFLRRSDGAWIYRTGPWQSAGGDADGTPANCALHEVPSSIAVLDSGSTLGYVRVTVEAPGKASAQYRFAPPEPPIAPPPPRPPAPAPPGACTAKPKSTAVQLRASVGGGAAITTGWGAKRRVQGRLTFPDGSPVANAGVCVASKPDVAGARMKAASTVVTDADGRFSYPVPPGPSRDLLFVHRIEGGAATAKVKVHVRAAVSLRVADHQLRTGQTMALRGRLASPKRGVLVELQVWSRDRWRTLLGTVRTKGEGRFRGTYTFTARTVGVQRYRFRALVPSQPGYPFAAGASKPVVVRVQG